MGRFGKSFFLNPSGLAVASSLAGDVDQAREALISQLLTRHARRRAVRCFLGSQATKPERR